MNLKKLGAYQSGITVALSFTYMLIVIVIVAVVAGFVSNRRLNAAIEEALSLGEAEKILIEDYFETHGQMPQSPTELGLDQFMPSGVLQGLNWLPGDKNNASSDPLRTGTLNGLINLSEFGARFADHESGFLLIARAQDDGSISWDCVADVNTANALPEKYLPESCAGSSDSEE